MKRTDDGQRTSGHPGLIEWLVIIVMTIVAAWFVDRLTTYGLAHRFAWDLVAHINITAIANQYHTMPGHFLFFVMLSLPSGFSTDSTVLAKSAPSVMALVTAARLPATWWVLRSLGSRGITVARSRTFVRLEWLIWPVLAVCMTLVYSLPMPTNYVGQFPPNVWHSATTNTLMPFAIIGFYVAHRYLRRPMVSTALLLAAVGVMSVAAKPSFAIAFIPVFALFIATSHMARRWKIIGLAALGAIVAAVFAQYLWIYMSKDFDQFRISSLEMSKATSKARYENRSTGIVIAPFRIWSTFSSNIPVSLLSSILFPLTVVIARPREVFRSNAGQLAWAMYGSGLLIAILFAENGGRALDGNLLWQCVVCGYLLFLVSLALLMRPVAPRRWARDVLAWCAFAVHVLAGIDAVYLLCTTSSYFTGYFPLLGWMTWAR